MTDGVESRMLREIMARTSTDKRLNSADELTRLRTENAALRATLKQAREYEALYHELVMLVGNKYPNETRHETAKRYIASVEIPRSGQTGGEAAIDKVQL